MASGLYPTQLLVSPLYVQERLPPVLQNVDFEAAMALHTIVALFTSFFWVHPPWLLPLSLFGLVACTPSLTTTLLPHFSAFWTASIAFDVAWLVHRSDQARSIIVVLVGLNMLFKVVSALQAARILQAQGAIPDVGQGGGQRWLNGHSTPAFGLPGSWSSQGAYRDGPTAHASSERGASAAPYQSIYDEEAQAQEDDAPQVRVENVASSVAAAAAARSGQSVQEQGTNKSQYRAIG